jgi:hypothetical protein
MTLARYTAGPAGNNLQMWPARNPGSEEIPAFACVKIDSVLFLSDDQIVYNLSKPDTFGSQWGHAFNGPRPIAAGGNDYGHITVGPLAVGMYDTADGTPEAGQFWGPRDADWKLRKSTGGFRVLGTENQNQYSGQRTDLIVVQHWPMLTLIGKADAIISSDTTGTVSIYWRQPNPAGFTLTDTGVNISARNRLETDIAANDWTMLNWFPHGWEIVRQQAY